MDVVALTENTRQEAVRLIKRTFALAEGDSNDEEIQGLQEVRDFLAELVGFDPEDDTCHTCWGIVPPEGVTMVPDDGELCSCKREVLVYAWIVPESSGGYQWAFTDEHGAAEEVRRLFIEDEEDTSGAPEIRRLAIIEVADYLDAAHISDLFEGELQDAVATGAVGRRITYDQARDAA